MMMMMMMMRTKGMPPDDDQEENQGRVQDFALGARPKGRRPRSGGWVPGEGQQPPPHQLWGMGSAVSSPSGVRGGALTAQRFPLFSALKMASSDTIILLIVDYHAAIGGQDQNSMSKLRKVA